MRTAAVAERAGVSQGALLHHFANKEELTLAAIEYALSNEETRSLSLAGKPTKTRDAVLSAMMEDFRTFFLTNGFWVALDTTMDSGRDTALQKRVTAIVGKHRQPVYDIWVEKLSLVGFAEADAREIVILTASIISGLAMRSLWQDISILMQTSLATWVSIIDTRWPKA